MVVGKLVTAKEQKKNTIDFIEVGLNLDIKFFYYSGT